jgi:glutamate/tyrosine decarboxylase-like PLP-dependent enzyme
VTPDPLALDPQTMRELGYRTVDLLVGELTDLERPPLRRATPPEMRARLGGPAPEGPEDFEALLEVLRTDVLAFMERSFHPGFFAFVPSNGTWPGALGDFVAAAMNIYAGHWQEAAGPCQVELDVLDWFKTWIGYPDGAAGALVSGGSAANMTALACAREARVGAMRPDLVAYVSDQAHSSMARAARVLGFRSDQLRVLPSDARYRLPPRLLRNAIQADRRAGRTPLLVAAAAGATNTGSVDPLPELAEVCAEHGLWLHADAAYGGFAVLTERGRAALAGLELADSVTMDPHKWLYQPIECGALLVRDGPALRAAFTITPPYLQDVAGGEAETDFSDLGMQLSRSARALKVWLSIRTFGLGAFRAAIERSLDLAAHAAERVRASPALELLAPPSLGIVCLRRRLDGPGPQDEDALAQANARLLAGLERENIAFASSTRLRGRYAVRLCVLNHTTTREHVDRTLDHLESAPLEPYDPGTRVAGDRRRAWAAHWGAARDGGAGTHPGPEDLAGVPLFAATTAQQRRLATALGVLRDAPAGTTVVQQWEVSRDFFVLLAGEAVVDVDGLRVATLVAGDVFGEAGALDWGRGYGYARTASVVAATPLRLLVFPDGALNELMREVPAVRSAVLAVLHANLPTA